MSIAGSTKLAVIDPATLIAADVPACVAIKESPINLALSSRGVEGSSNTALPSSVTPVVNPPTADPIAIFKPFHHSGAPNETLSFCVICWLFIFMPKLGCCCMPVFTLEAMFIFCFV